MEYPQFFHQMPINLLFVNHLYILRNLYIYIYHIFIHIFDIYIHQLYIYIYLYLSAPAWPHFPTPRTAQNSRFFAHVTKPQLREKPLASRWTCAAVTWQKWGSLTKKKWKWWWYAGYMEICWFYGVSSVYDIWRYMEIYGDMCYNSIYQPSNMFFFMLEHHLCLQNGDVQWPVDPSGFETSWSVTTERFYGPQWLDWNLQYNQEYGDCQWYIYIYIIIILYIYIIKIIYYIIMYIYIIIYMCVCLIVFCHWQSPCFHGDITI